MPYGCFVEFPHNLSGLAPTKYLSDELLSDASGVYQEGQSVMAKVNVHWEGRRRRRGEGGGEGRGGGTGGREGQGEGKDRGRGKKGRGREGRGGKRKEREGVEEGSEYVLLVWENDFVGVDYFLGCAKSAVSILNKIVLCCCLLANEIALHYKDGIICLLKNQDCHLAQPRKCSIVTRHRCEVWED